MSGKLSAAAAGKALGALSLAGELVVLNFAMLVCCLPVITAGASVSAGYACAQRMLRSEQDASVLKDFFASFKRNFAQATELWLLQLLASAVLAGDIYYATQIAQPRSTFFLVFGIAGLLLCFALSLWVYPVQARFENSLGGHLKNGALLCVTQLPKTLLMMVLWLAPLALTLCVPEILRALGWVWLMCGFALLQYAAAALIRPVLDGGAERREK